MYRPYSIVDSAEIMLIELHQLLASGPDFRIRHRYQMSGESMQCGPGEEIASVELIHRGRATLLPLSLSLLFVFDCLARSRHVPRSATQIAATIRSSQFYRKHGMNSGVASTRTVVRSSIKAHIHKIRLALDAAFKETGVPLDGKHVLVAQETFGSQSLYRLRATVSWVHSKN